MSDKTASDKPQLTAQANQLPRQDSAMGGHFEGPGTYILHQVQGEESIPLKDMYVPCTYKGLVAYVNTRKKDLLIKNQPAKCMGVNITMQPRTNTITLNVFEHGGMKGVGMDYWPSAVVEGKAQFSEDHKTVTDLLRGDYTFEGLAKKIRTLRHLFATRTEWEKVYLALRNTQVKISTIMENTGNDQTGERKKQMHSKVVDEESNPPIEWNFFYSIFEGEDPVNMLVQENRELTATGVSVKLAAFDFTQIERDMSKKMMENTVTELQKALPSEVVPYILLN